MKLKLRQMLNTLAKTDSQAATEIGKLYGEMIPRDLISQAADGQPVTAIHAAMICKWLSQQFGKEIKPQDIADLKVHPASALPDENMTTEAMLSFLQSKGYRVTAPVLQPEPMYEEGDYLKGDLAPKNWKALANPQVPWPEDLDPKMVLHELTPFLKYQMLRQKAASSGRDIRALIGPDEEV